MNFSGIRADFSSLGKVLSAFAVLMLVFAGASFTHFRAGDHSHAPDGQIVESQHTHDHADRSTSDDQSSSQALHCGASILLLTEHYQIQGDCFVQSHLPVNPISLSETALGFDPPPPRKIS